MKTNSILLAGAICGGLIWTGFFGLIDTFKHKGPGTVEYASEPYNPYSDGGEWTPALVPEGRYKAHKYFDYSLLLYLGLAVWVIVVRSEKTKTEDKL
jgi:hypothetical protein